MTGHNFKQVALIWPGHMCTLSVVCVLIYKFVVFVDSFLCVALESQPAAALQTGPTIFGFFLEGSDKSVSSKLADEDFAAVPNASFKVVAP